MKTWLEFEDFLRGRGATDDEIPRYKQYYWSKLDPLLTGDPEEKEKKRKKFLDIDQVNPIAALKTGFEQSWGGAIHHLSNIADLTGFDEGAAKLKEKSEKIAAKVPEKNVDTIIEKVASFVGATPGVLATFAPYVAAAGAVLEPTPLGETALAAAVPSAIAFALHGGVEESDKGVKAALKGAGKGALMGAALGPARMLPRTLGVTKSALKSHAAHGAGVGTVFGTAAALEGGSGEDIAASALSGLILGSTSRGAKKRTAQIEENLKLKEGKGQEVIDILDGKSSYVEQVRAIEKLQAKEFAAEVLKREAEGVSGRPGGPKPLVVANVGKDGKVYYGRPGDIHSNLTEKYPNAVPWRDVGFAVEGGKFLSRKEALDYVDGLGKFRSNTPGELDALDYREQRRSEISGRPLGATEEYTVNATQGIDKTITAGPLRSAYEMGKQKLQEILNKNEDPFSAFDANKILDKVWGLATRTGVTLGPKFAGEYHSKSHLIRMRNLSDVGTKVHEIMHHVRRNEPGFRLHNLPTALKDEMIARGKKMYPNSKDRLKLVEEGMAEYLAERFVRGATTKYPLMNEFFNNLMEKDQGLAKKVFETQEVYQKLMNQSAAERARSATAFDFVAKNTSAFDRLPERAYKGWVESGNSLEKLRDDINDQRKAQGREAMSPEDDFWIEFRHARGSSGAMSKEAVEEGIIDPKQAHLGPLTKGLPEVFEMAGVVGNFKAAQDFMVLWEDLRAVEAIALKKIDGRGLPRDPNETVARARADGTFQKWEPAIREMNKFGNTLVKLAVREGVLTKEAGKAITWGRYWAPLTRFLEETEQPTQLFPGIKGGSGQKYLNPIQALSMQTGRVFDQINFNGMMRSILKAERESRGMGGKVFEISKYVPVKKGKSGKVERFNDRTNTVTFYEKGKPVSLEFSKEIYSAFKNMDELNWGTFYDKVIGGPKRLATLGMTGLNAGFQLITNPIRDAMLRAIQSVEPGLPAIKGSARAYSTVFKQEILRKTLGQKITADPSYLRMKAIGVQVAGPVGLDIRNDMAFADKMVRGGKITGAQFVSHPIESLREILSWSEMINRFPEWKLAEAKYGEGTPAAVMAGHVWASDVTIDFRRMGTYGRAMNSMIPFFNASIQGPDKFYRTIKERPLESVLTAAATLTAPALALWAVNKDEKWYQELPMWEKMVFIHMKIGDNILRLPVPFEWGVLFATYPIAQIDAAYNKSPAHAKEATRRAFDVLMPIDGPMPIQALKPFAEAYFNEDTFRGTPLESQAMQRRLPRDRFTKYTPESYKLLGQLTGFSPIKLQHVAEGYTGGLIRDWADAWNPKSYTNVETTPYIQRLFSKTERPGQSVNDFYNELKSMREVWGSVGARIQSGDRAGAIRLLKSNAKLLGITQGEAAGIAFRASPTTPRKLKKFESTSGLITAARKRNKPDEMTDIARKIMGK